MSRLLPLTSNATYFPLGTSKGCAAAPRSFLGKRRAKGESLRGGVQRGISLIELIMFIVIISIAVAGILLVMNKVTGHSADTLVRKQALAVAESLLEEIELQAMSGVNASTGSVNADRRPFDNVFNYHGYTTTVGMRNMDATTVPGLGSYNVTAVTVANTPGVWGGIAVTPGSAVVITVSVTGPGGQIDLTGYRAGNCCVHNDKIKVDLRWSK